MNRPRAATKPKKPAARPKKAAKEAPHTNPTKKPARAKRTTKKATPARGGLRRKMGAPSLLILHLDSAKLQSDGLHLTGPAAFASTWAGLGMRAEVEAIDGTDLQNLLRQLWNLAENGREFDVVVVVGHSNADGIRISADMFADWEAFAGYLRPFAPRRLLLVACKAGLSTAGDALFRRLPKLRRIYASPVNASKLLGELIQTIEDEELKKDH